MEQYENSRREGGRGRKRRERRIKREEGLRGEVRQPLVKTRHRVCRLIAGLRGGLKLVKGLYQVARKPPASTPSPHASRGARKLTRS